MAFLVGDVAMRVLRYGWTTLKGYGEVSLMYYTVLHCITLYYTVFFLIQLYLTENLNYTKFRSCSTCLGGFGWLWLESCLHRWHFQN